MADHRKSFRPRRLIFDGRLLPRGRLFGAALALLCAVAAVPGAVFSQEVGLKRGEASLNTGKYEDAVRQFSATVNDNDSTVAQASKALYMRGIAYRKLGFPGRAVADLGAAVWLGLGSSDKTRALVNKGLAFREAGLSSQAEAALSQARRTSSAGEVQRVIAQDSGARAVASTSVQDAGPSGSVWDRIVPSFGSSDGSEPAPAEAQAQAPASAPAAAPAPTQTAEAAPSTGWDASVADETAEQSGNAVSRWFGSLTGSSASTATAPAPSATTPAPPPPAAQSTSSASTATRTAAAPPPSAESWAANTQTVSEDESGTAVGRWFSRQTSSSSAPAPAAAPAPQGGGYTVQLANSRSQSEAQALWKKAKSSNPQIASVSPRIETVDIGDFGTFYTVKLGPFASQSEGTKVCNALKRGGTDCSVISPDGP